MANSKSGKRDDGEKVNFRKFGDESEPEALDRLFQRPAELPRGDPPRALVHAQNHRKVYLRSDKKPDLQLGKSEHCRKADVYELTIPTRDAADMHLPGREAVRDSPRVIVDQIAKDVSFDGHRPKWIPGTYYPRSLPDLGRREMMRRMNGRATRPLWVFGPDDRVAYMDSTWPWGLVGKVFTSGGWTGSAALIGPRLIATAGHVVPWGSGSWWMRFVPAFHNGSSLHGAGVESYVSDARGYNTNGSVTGYDWAVCRLYEPLGDWLGYFGYNGYSSSWEGSPYWTLLGYPGAVASGQRPSWQGSVSSFDADSDSNGGLEIETKADLTPGNSGGPMFGWWNGDPRLVGVVSGQEEDWSPGFWPWEWGDTERGNVIAGGSGFTNLMAWGRSNWPL